MSKFGTHVDDAGNLCWCHDGSHLRAAAHPKRMWSRGPWRARLDPDVTKSADVVDECDPGHPVAWTRNAADRSLIALGPGMAEAILAWSEGQHGDFEAQSRATYALHDLAARLLHIDGVREV